MALGVIFCLLMFKTNLNHLSGWRELFSHSPRESRHRGRERRRREGETPAECREIGVVCSSEYFSAWHAPHDASCATTLHNGYPVPDPRCTPGGIDPSVTAETLRNHAWRTGCIRDCQTSEAEKHAAYRWYGVRVPRRNYGETQVCELDHLVPLELGGADGLGNIWPQCGPPDVALRERYFKLKDRVESYLAEEVRLGKMPLKAAQRGIAADWTRYLDAASQYCESGGRCD
jgi:hypothetical protein